jgi:hypothetical protein
MERGFHSPSGQDVREDGHGLPAHLERSVQDLVTAGAVPIPPYPAVALRVKQAAVQKNVGLAEISRLVRSDGALAADWVIVRSCQPDRDGFRLELQPYALSGEERAAWDRLLEGG